jgi:hypothetical protein
MGTTPSMQIVGTDRGRKLEVYIDELSDEAKARVGLAFNPSNSPDIDLAKALSVGPMEMALRVGHLNPALKMLPRSLIGRATATAATHFEAGQMFLVKAIAHTFKKD